MDDELWALTEKEKQTLRLIVRGHDGKSIARTLDLSVHTVNERLRDARRKMAVSSSREAARMLLAAESKSSPETIGDKHIGADADVASADLESASSLDAGRPHRPWILSGVILMTLVLGLLALVAAPDLTVSPPQATSAAAHNPEVVEVAQEWLELGDEGQWEEAYDATAIAFRKLNTLKVWIDVSEKVRAPLGNVISRTFVSQENLPAPPRGYEVVKFRTRFANKGETIETVSFDREGGEWRVVGVTLD
ncbi:DUF4019 domain-containing protein [Sphingomonas sp. IW22]|uniref:helix-turn-helix domain-containing protein n=1 Tax=Sphingomonas sp. IW22 TaxID=3242489 RepID=UPI00352181DE